MTEPEELQRARDHLAKAEAMLMSEAGLAHLRDGLACLEAVIEAGREQRSRSVARTVAQTYASRIYDRIRRTLDDPRLPEPAVQHLFGVMRVFDDACTDLPPGSRDVKVEVVRRLVDLYYEGHTDAEKQNAYRQLAEIAGRRNDT